MEELIANASKTPNEMIPNNSDTFVLDEVYIDGKLKKAELVNEQDKSYGIFMHSLVLSNSIDVANNKKGSLAVLGDDYEKAVYYYAFSKGFNKNLLENIAPKVTDLVTENEGSLTASTHLINGKFRLITKGVPEVLFKRCTYFLCDSKIIKLSRRILTEINDAIRVMISRSLNVYAIAIKDTSNFPDSINFDKSAFDMTLVALVGIGNS